MVVQPLNYVEFGHPCFRIENIFVLILTAIAELSINIALCYERRKLAAGVKPAHIRTLSEAGTARAAARPA
jgi:hypothetical protein